MKQAEKQTAIVALRMKPEERRELEQAAKKEGVSLSELIRLRLFGELVITRVRPVTAASAAGK